MDDQAAVDSAASVDAEIIARAWTVYFHHSLSLHELHSPAPTADVVAGWEASFRGMPGRAILDLANAALPEPQRGGSEAPANKPPRRVALTTLLGIAAFGWTLGGGTLAFGQPGFRGTALVFLLIIGIGLPAALVIVARMTQRRARP